jgi:hypothetical protein
MGSYEEAVFHKGNCAPFPVAFKQAVSLEKLIVKSFWYQQIQPSLGCAINTRIDSLSKSPCGHVTSIFLKSYGESETASGMLFEEILYISGLRSLIRNAKKNCDFIYSKPLV